MSTRSVDNSTFATPTATVSFRGKIYEFGNKTMFTEGYKDSYYRRPPRNNMGEEYLAGYEYNETVDFNFKDWG